MANSRRGTAVLCLTLFGCGPAVATSGDGETGDASDSSGTTTAGSTTSVPPTTAPSTSPSATSPDPSTVTGRPEPITTGPSDDSSTGPVPPVPNDIPVSILTCSVWDDTCPDGQTCVAWSNDNSGVWNDARCSPVGPDQSGEPCTVEGNATSGIDSCAEDLMCFGVDPETNTGHCVARCRGSENAPWCDDPTTFCARGNEGSINLCLPTCDPLSQDCPEGEACYDVDGSGCMRPGTPLVSQPDQLIPAFCPPGSTAILPELDASCEDDTLCCATWCDLSIANSCGPGASCEPWLEEGIVFGYADVGLCVVVP